VLQQGQRYYKYQLKSYHAISGNVGHVPVHGGMYITPSTGSALEEGTVGGIVTLAGKPYILAAAHTFLGKGRTVRVGRGPTTVVGTVTHWVDRLTGGGNDLADASLARPSVAVSFDIPSVGIPRGHTPAKVGMKVKGYGAKSGFKTGTVLGIDEAVEGKRAINTSLAFGPGDSGALILNDQNLVVGLFVIAQEHRHATTGALIKKLLLCTPVEGIIKAYPGVNFAGKAGTFQPNATITGLPASPLPGTTPPPTPVPKPGTPSPSPTTPNDPIAALLEMILAFIKDILATLGIK
jgi:hypothetical protein